MANLSIALIPNYALGDGLVALIIAHNLCKNGFKVTVIHNALAQLNNWFEYDIVSFPEKDHKEVLDGFDLVLTDHATPLQIDCYSPEQHLNISSEFVFFAFTIYDERFFRDHRERLRLKVGDEKAHLLRHLAVCGRKIVYGSDLSMVENVVRFCRETLKLENVDDDIGFDLPAKYIRKRYADRVVIAPTSALDKKNWSLDKFILLAIKLKKDGFKPVFSFTPEERSLWADKIPSEFEVPQINSLTDFAVLLYESNSFIGNDSGGGHLASALGLPTLTIVNSSKKSNFKWRPGWSRNQVVVPSFSFRFRGKRYWRLFLTVGRTHRVFFELLGSDDIVSVE